MTPQSQENTPSFDLPSPEKQEKSSLQEAENFNAQITETQSAKALEQGISATQATQAVDDATSSQASVPTSPPPVMSDDDQGQSQTFAGTSWMPDIADDTDLIEKEWVDKAKEIVAQTAHDPYLQNKEMNKVRADYMRKRYNKEIKLNED